MNQKDVIKNLKVSLKEEARKRVGLVGSPPLWVKSWYDNYTYLGLGLCENCSGETRFPIEEVEIWIDDKKAP